jgi:hypothetical protein
VNVTQLEEERLSESELSSLRERLHAVAPDAVSLEDVAEAAGVSLIDAQEQLRQLRAERAFQLPPKKASQAPLAILAVAMFATAGYIWHIRQPEDLDAKLARIQAEHKARLPQIRRDHPLPQIGVPKDLPLPPRGFTIHFRGMYRELTVNPKGNTIPLAEVAKKQLAISYYAALCLFAKEEPNHGKLKPLSNPMMGWQQANDNMATVMLGNSMEQVALVPDPGQTQGQLIDMWKYLCDRSAVTTVDMALQNQNKQILDPPDSPFNQNLVQPPYGFNVTAGASGGFGGSSILLAPVPKFDFAGKLVQSVKSYVLAARSNRGMAFQTLPTDKTLRLLPFTKVRIQGPLRAVEFDVPNGSAPGYASAADAERAADRIIAENCRIAADQMDEVNRLARDQKE